jgi:putative membrane protein
MRRPFLLLASLAAVPLMAAAAHAQPALPTPQFIHVAAATDAFEREAGKLAEKHARSGKVKRFGAMMVRDHGKTTEGLKHAIKKAGLPPPPPPEPTPDQTAMLDSLRPLHGRDFDKAYIGGQITVHQQALAAMQAYAQGGDNPDLREAAGKTVPIVEHHLMVAQKLEAAMH